MRQQKRFEAIKGFKNFVIKLDDHRGTMIENRDLAHQELIYAEIPKIAGSNRANSNLAM